MGNNNIKGQIKVECYYTKDFYDKKTKYNPDS